MTSLSVKPMSPGKAWLILIGLFFVLACAIYWPLNEFRQQQLQSEANLERLVLKKRSIIEGNKQLSSNVAAVKKEINQSKLIELSSSSKAMNQLQTTVREISARHLISLTQMQILNPKKRGPLSQLFISIKGYSSIPKFYRFLVELENHKPLIRVTNANIVPFGNNKGLAKLNFNFTLTMLNGAPL
ncbi:MAG: hypothetical protein CMM24_07245 [Rhodospirillaceae bacterium]|nr:hypothetical protein [Rhodospirillaceae bacterium]